MLSKFIEFPNNLIEKWQLLLTENDIDATVIVNSFNKVYAFTVSTKIETFNTD